MVIGFLYIVTGGGKVLVDELYKIIWSGARMSTNNEQTTIIVQKGWRGIANNHHASRSCTGTQPTVNFADSSRSKYTPLNPARSAHE